MRLLIISLAIFVVCFGLFGCTNARSSSNRKKKCECPCRTKTPIKTPNFFFVTSQKISTIQHFTNERIISNREITNRPQSNFKSYDSLDTMTYNCANNNIYMLKYNSSNVSKKTLDVIQFDGKNKFERINQIENMFDNATSIASDYMRDKIYWTVNNDGNYSIKVTDNSFKESNYIIYPNNKIRMEKIQVYPKRSEIFFSEDNKIWYTSNLPNSTPNLLLTCTHTLIDFAIDYATNDLCWLENHSDPIYFMYYCVNIDASPRPIDKPMSKFYRLGEIFGNLEAFNNTLYWTENIGPRQLLYAKDEHKTWPVLLATLKNDEVQSFVSLNCPSI
ncbi:uncharacterized protein LOC122847652 [Aphidius gifuensis]|uniref:uncharacterized protein LOC122847652 n=1 Tax=Aphidius gifuensis TaxID=684658 RepID=UPI001CDB7690|nr:uncharacterized protein LOC122847652 [Aphidius gifuensis]